ncbi:MAG: hypothetical protein ACOCZ5_01005 [bacterium]
MEVRYSLSKKKFKEKNKKNINKVKNKFIELSKEIDVSVDKINCIVIGRETFYNPFLNKHYNRFVYKVNEVEG